MLSTLHALTIATALAAPRVDVSTLDGRSVSGEFVSLSRTSLTVKTDGGDEKLAVANLLEVTYPTTEGSTAGDRDKARVVLVDGTRIEATAVEVNGRGAAIDGVRVGELDIPARALASIRFAGSDEKFDATWAELARRSTKQDLLVVRKTDVLDHLKGIIGDVTGQSVRFAIGGNEIPVKLSKVYGVVYGGARNAGTTKPICLATLNGGDQLALASVAWDEDAYIGRLALGGSVTIAPEDVRSLDFSIGKVLYLSKVEPDRVDHVPYFGDDPFDDWSHFRRDRNQNAKPIVIGRRTFDRGLWIHSRTTVRYRLAGEYRTFKAIMGMEAIAARKNNGNDVRVTIVADDEKLLDTYVTSSDEPVDLELKVEDANFLEITVDYGKDGWGTLDHLALGDARVLK